MSNLWILSRNESVFNNIDYSTCQQNSKLIYNYDDYHDL